MRVLITGKHMTVQDRKQDFLLLTALIFWACLQNFEKRLLALSFLSQSIAPSVRMEQLSSYWTDFHEI
jgi:hypothetical protein